MADQEDVAWPAFKCPDSNMQKRLLQKYAVVTTIWVTEVFSNIACA